MNHDLRDDVELDRSDLPKTDEWIQFRENLVELRHRLERTLRREVVHDARSGGIRRQNVAPPDLADDAICDVLAGWRQKPAGTSPYSWMLKRGLQRLDEALDRERLAAESRAEERAVERAVHVNDLSDSDEERSRWLEVAGLANVNGDVGEEESAGGRPDFDSLEAPGTSSPEFRVAQTELLRQLELAMVKLPERRRRAVAYRYLDGLTDEDVGYLLDIPTPQVAVELQSGIEELRGQLSRG